jgi:hypothetical protein
MENRMIEFDHFSYHGHKARKSDPVTSKRAAHDSDKFANSHRSRILGALRLHGPRSASELEQIIGLSVAQIDRRTAESERMGEIAVVMVDGEPLVRGHCRVWRAVDHVADGAGYFIDAADRAIAARR